MEVSWNRGTPVHHPNFNGIFLYKPSILGVPPWLWKPPNDRGNPNRSLMARLRRRLTRCHDVDRVKVTYCPRRSACEWRHMTAWSYGGFQSHGIVMENTTKLKKFDGLYIFILEKSKHGWIWGTPMTVETGVDVQWFWMWIGWGLYKS